MLILDSYILILSWAMLNTACWEAIRSESLWETKLDKISLVPRSFPMS